MSSRSATDLLDHLRGQRTLLEGGLWEQAIQAEKPVELATWLSEIASDPEAVSVEVRRDIETEIARITSASEKLRDEARENITTTAPHQAHLRRLLRDLKHTRERVISEA